jgi:hypothetical protein
MALRLNQGFVSRFTAGIASGGSSITRSMSFKWKIRRQKCRPPQKLRGIDLIWPMPRGAIQGFLQEAVSK